jgi:integrase
LTNPSPEKEAAMPRPRGLTEKRITELRVPRNGKRYEVPDGKTPNLFIRVGSLTKVFVLQTRIAGEKNPSRRTIGNFPEISLERAQEIARQWNALIDRGLDPQLEKERVETEERLRKRRTFKSAMEDYIAWMPSREFNRHVSQDIATLRREFLNPERNPWLDEPIADVTKQMVKTHIEAIRDRPSSSQAFNATDLVRGFFSWAYNTHGESFGLAANPVANLTHKEMFLRRRVRSRTLDVYEVRAYWMASSEMRYPYGALFKMVLYLGGRRKEECTQMRWSEIDWSRKLWIVPKERVKHGEELGELKVPLTKTAIEFLEELGSSLPEGWGDCVFSTTNGQIPINGLATAMNELRTRTSAIFQELRPGKEMKGWVLHDVRRLMRTSLSSLGVEKEVAELVIGHRKKHDYNQDSFRPQVRRALVLFTQRLKEVLDGTASDFIADDLSEFA